MCESYNSPQSVYWCLKSFVAAGLGPDNPFWTCEELPYPRVIAHADGIHVCHPARQIVCNVPKGNHHFLLSSGQFCSWPLKATKEKYGKFAYSSVFGFSVPTGPRLPQLAPENTLLLSRDGGETWEARWKTLGETTISTAKVMVNCNVEESVPTLVSKWKPWADGEIEVETTLVPPTTRWPNWHIRLHRLRKPYPSLLADRERKLRVVEGGFAVPQQQLRFGKSSIGGMRRIERTEASEISALAVSWIGTSGVYDISPNNSKVSQQWKTAGQVIAADPNTNLLYPKTVIPVMHHELQNIDFSRCHANTGEMSEVTLVTGVFAVSFKGNKTSSEMPLQSDGPTSQPRIWHKPDIAPEGKGPWLCLSI